MDSAELGRDALDEDDKISDGWDERDTAAMVTSQMNLHRPSIGTAGSTLRQDTTDSSVSNEPRKKHGKETTSHSAKSGFYNNELHMILQTSRPEIMLQHRMALSKQACVFKIPMNMASLEAMTPQEYLRHQCDVAKHRHLAYQQAYDRMLSREKNTNDLSLKEAEDGLKLVLTGLGEEPLARLRQLLSLRPTHRIDYNLFAGMAALLERQLYSQFVTERTRDLPQHQREKLEQADFRIFALNSHTLKLDANLLELLNSLV